MAVGDVDLLAVLLAAAFGAEIVVPGLQRSTEQRQSAAEIDILHTVRRRQQEGIGPALKGVLGSQWRLEGPIARPRVATQDLHARFKRGPLEGVTQLGQVVLAAQLLRIAGVVLLAGIFEGVAEAPCGTAQAQPGSLARERAKRRARRAGNVVQTQQVTVGGGGQLRREDVPSVDQMAVAFDIGRVGAIVETVVARAEDRVDVVYVGIGQRQLIDRL